MQCPTKPQFPKALAATLYQQYFIPRGLHLQKSKPKPVVVKVTQQQQQQIMGSFDKAASYCLDSLLRTGCSTLQDILQFVLDNKLQDSYPNRWLSLRIPLTLSVATAKRSFSKLKPINTYIRSTMSEDRLSLLAILSIEDRVGSSIC